jgi:hypothetical protein
VKAPAVVPTQTLPRIPGHESIAHRDTHSTPEGLIAATPRQEIFPAPSPLSEQEKLLLRYLAGTPHEEVAAQSHGDDATPEDGGVPLPQSREFKIPEVFSTR